MKYKVVMEFPSLVVTEAIKEKEFDDFDEMSEYVVKALAGESGLCRYDPVPTFLTVYTYSETGELLPTTTLLDEGLIDSGMPW